MPALEDTLLNDKVNFHVPVSCTLFVLEAIGLSDPLKVEYEDDVECSRECMAERFGGLILTCVRCGERTCTDQQEPLTGCSNRCRA